MDKDAKKVVQLKSDDPDFYKKFVNEWNYITNKLKDRIEKENENQEVVNTSQYVSSSSVIFK